MARIATLVVAVAAAAWSAPLAAQQVFPSPDAASKALVDAAKAGEPGFVARIFGPEGPAILGTGDPERDKERLAQFNAAAADATALAARGDTTRILQIGRNGFEFPVPIVKRGEGWVYDVAAGREEILNRTIGENELHAIEACRTYIAAQREYFRLDHDDDEVQEYAQRILSSPGKRDGLYWPRQTQWDISPLEGRISQAILERQSNRSEPYFGYTFRILKAQGPSAPGGAYSYVINGKMIAGFALIAAPAEWGKTGVMTFICNQSGRVWQKNLGPGTAREVARIKRYDPDPSWTRLD
ncbi:DUF2950 domain-containing protein [Alsobacter sp. R-9]